ncbi:MAG: biotin synthase BioB [Candidatus Dactylopiibacterium sp.]|nr:biotin synthase BioB [Candidatus Dactylopiibacterium sp.]
MNACSPAEHAVTFHRPARAPEGEWSTDAVAALFELPFSDLIFRAQEVHRKHFDPNAIQRSTLLSIKTGGCSEDCSYCSQSKRYRTGLTETPLMALEDVLEMARAARDKGATRFCMGAAWRSPKERDLEPVLEMVREVKKLGIETCVTLGMLKDGQAERLREAGLDYYNHNLDTAREFYGEIVTTHTLDDRLETIEKVRRQGIKVCAGGIVGLGENRRARAVLIAQLASLTPPPESVPINGLVPIAGTPLEAVPTLDPLEFVRTIAVARITMPTSFVRLSAGRQQMSDEVQALCYLAGANSIFAGDRLLTTDNPASDRDAALFARLGLRTI